MTAPLGLAFDRSAVAASIRAPDSHAPVGIEELRALSELDELVAPELAEPEPHCFARPAAFADDLRLPAPERRSPDGEALFRSMTAFVRRFEATSAAAVAAPAEAVEAEARLGALLRGIHGLEVEIRERAARNKRI